MKSGRSLYCGHRYPPEIISHAVWLYHRFSLSFREVEEMLATRGIIVTYETIRQWCLRCEKEGCGSWLSLTPKVGSSGIDLVI